jgi:hypothetical protein
MTKKILPFLLLVAIVCVSFFSCRKVNVSTTDITRNYFPLQFGKYVTYAVDSTYFTGSNCSQLEVKSQMKYSITDTFRDSKSRLSYIMDIFTRPYDGGIWQASGVIYVTPVADSIFYTQDQTQYLKLIFPIANGTTWMGNKYAVIQNPTFSYLAGWNYVYQNYNYPYNNGLLNFNNTVTVLEDDESQNYPNIDSQVSANRTYAKEVYAYNVGMIYKEWTHWTYKPDSAQCVDGYTVIMKAIDHN